jgi:phage terminase large subunit GpA-like protein
MDSPNDLGNWQPPDGLADAAGAYWAGFAEGIRPDPEMLVADWADTNRVLSSKASAEAGPWRTSRTPYLREVMNCLSVTHPMSDGTLQAGTQLGKSESLFNWLGYIIDQAPGPIMYVLPTTDVAKKVSKQRVAPAIEECGALRRKVRDSRSRDSGNTTLLKEFDGGLLAIVGANSGPALRSMPIRYLMLDEIDAYPHDVDDEGDPEEVAEKRTDTFGARAKRMRVSTPKLAGTSRIDSRRRAGSNARYYIPCPHCDHEQYLRWAQMRWEMRTRRELVCTQCGGISELARDAEGEAICHHCDAWVPVTDETTREAQTDEVARAWYECESCAGEIAEHHKPAILERGRWIHQNVGSYELLADDDPHPWALWQWVGKAVKRVLPAYTRPISWHLPALYSPLGWFSWSKAVEKYLKAKAGGVDESTDEPLMQVFENTVLAQPYGNGTSPADEVLRLRAEPYRMGQVPKDCLLLVASVDVQGDRLEALCVGFGRDGHMWIIDHQRFYGDSIDMGPTGPWEQLTAWRRQGWQHAGGGKLRIVTMAVDSGYLSHTVYWYCAMHRTAEVFAVKGQSESGKPLLGLPRKVDINHRGQKIPNGCELWPVGSDTAKERIYRALELKEPGHGWIHLPSGLSDDFFEQLTAEKLDRKRLRNQWVNAWVLPKGKRNEILDLVAYALAAGERAGVRRVNWDDLEQRVNPRMLDLFADAPVDEASDESASYEIEKPEVVTADLQAQPSSPPRRRQPRPRNFATQW